EFEIEYEVHGNIVRFLRREDTPAHERIQPIDCALYVKSGENEDRGWAPEDRRSSWASSGSGLLPDKVVGYSTGPTSGLQWALAKSIERLVRNIEWELDAS